MPIVWTGDERTQAQQDRSVLISTKRRIHPSVQSGGGTDPAWRADQDRRKQDRSVQRWIEVGIGVGILLGLVMWETWIHS